MASISLTAASPQLPAERFFRASLFLLIVTGAVCIVSTGKLDLLSSVLVVTGLLYKGHRWWNQASPEISTRVATWLVTGYLGFFPIDIFVFSRMYSANSTNPVLYATLFAAIHFLFFITLVRLYSATSDRDAVFLAMLSFAAVLSSAVLTVDTAFLILFFVYMLFAVAVFATLELWRGVALATFDGAKWSSGGKGSVRIFANGDGWIPVTTTLAGKTDRARLLQYTVLMEPMASDALFVPGVGVAVRGNFTSDRLSPFGGRGSYLLRDPSDSIYNPFHNFVAMRYFGVSRLPQFQLEKLRAAGTDYP